VKIKEALDKLDVGNSVAEFDTALEDYFVETNTFRRLTEDRGDIIAGDKGTGKTALYQILRKRYRGIRCLDRVEVLSGFNPTGNPVFQRLTEETVLAEGQYLSIWKAYVLALVGNWVLGIYDGSFSEQMRALDALLTNIGMRTTDGAPNTVFSRMWNTIKRWTNPKSAEFKMSLSSDGLPEFAPSLQFENSKGENETPVNLVRHAEALKLLNDVLSETGTTVWVVLDRLDEAFQGFPNTEIPALRALLRTYLDLLEFPGIKLKLFVRNDLFRKIIEGGFVNLTHINARKINIVWDQDDLFNLLYQRFLRNTEFLASLDLLGKPANAYGSSG
jgi:hypothetical protein